MRALGPSARSQRGAALFFALIILGLMTLLAVSAYGVSSVSLKLVSNVQARQEATAAADQAAQQVISSATFQTSAQPYTTTSQVDVNNDDVADFTATVTASCITFKPYPAPGQILDPTDGCASSAVQGNPSLSVCYQVLWDVTSHVVPAAGAGHGGNTGTDVTVHQGVSTQMSYTDTLAACP